MPKQTVNMLARMLTTSSKDPQEVIARIKQAKVGIEVYVFYFDALKHKRATLRLFIGWRVGSWLPTWNLILLNQK